MVTHSVAEYIHISHVFEMVRLKASNAPTALSVLRGEGDHLTSGDLQAFLFHKECMYRIFVKCTHYLCVDTSTRINYFIMSFLKVIYNANEFLLLLTT